MAMKGSMPPRPAHSTAHLQAHRGIVAGLMLAVPQEEAPVAVQRRVALQLAVAHSSLWAADPQHWRLPLQNLWQAAAKAMRVSAPIAIA